LGRKENGLLKQDRDGGGKEERTPTSATEKKEGLAGKEKFEETGNKKRKG